MQFENLKMANTWKLGLVISLILTRNLIQAQNVTEKANSKPIVYNEFEFCVKIVMICFLVFDSPHDYEDIDESETNEAEALKNVDDDFRRASCIPKNLKANDLKTFWQNVRIWQKVVKDLLLTTNLFSIREEFDSGNTIKLNLWFIFKIRKYVICNRNNDVINTTTTDYTIPTTIEPQTTIPMDNENECNENQVIGNWINEQLQTGESSDGLIKMLPDILAKLELQINRNCCPYPILRDRIEVINDYVDTIMQLKALDLYERVQSTGSALLDVRNLKIRMNYLNRTTNSKVSNKCCNNWELQLNDAKHKFQVNKDYIQGVLSTSTNYNALNQNLQNLKQILNQQENRIQSNPSTNGSLFNNKNCCNSFDNNINNIKTIINDIKLYELQLGLSRDLSKSVLISSVAMKNTKLLISNEQTKVNNLNATCTEKCAHKQKIKELKLQSYAKFDQVIGQLEQMSITIDNKSANTYIENGGLKQLQSYKQKLNEILSQSNKSVSRVNNSLFDFSKNEFLNNCLDRIKQLTELEKLTKDNQANNMNSHREYKLRTENSVKNLNDKLDDFLKKQPIENNQDKLLGNLEKRLKEILPLTTNSTESENIQYQQIIDFENNLDDNLADDVEKTKPTDTLHSKIKQSMEERFLNLEQKLNASGLGNELNYGGADVFSKLDYLEAVVKNMTDQSKGKEKRMLDKLADLEKNLKAVNEKINKAEAAAKKCNAECDFGELPSIEVLEKRLQALQGHLKKKP